MSSGQLDPHAVEDRIPGFDAGQRRAAGDAGLAVEVEPAIRVKVGGVLQGVAAQR